MQAKEPITLKDVLPAGLEAVGIEGAVDEGHLNAGSQRRPIECSLKALSCTFTGKQVGSQPTYNGQYFAVSVPPYQQVQMEIAVRATGAETGAVNEASVTGGGAPPVSAERHLIVSDEAVPFGAARMKCSPNSGGRARHAGRFRHPFQLTTTFVANIETRRRRPPVGRSRICTSTSRPG